MSRHTILLTAAFLTLLSAVSALAEENPAGQHTMVNPDWVKRPTPESLLAVFPSQAFKRGISGKASIRCTVTVQGALTDCTVLSETPEGAGFGSAAIALTPQMMMKPATQDGRPIPSSVNIPINFKAPAPGLQPPELGRRVVTAAIAWAEAPSYADVAAAYPKKAQEQRLGGRATLGCDLSEEGRLKNCSTIASEPSGYGFEAAARTLAKSFKINVSSDEDRKLTRTLAIHLPVTFDATMLNSAERVVGKPNWVQRPTSEQMQLVARSLTLTSVARAALQCEVQPQGLLSACKSLSEEPDGVGVGRAALALAPTFRVSTWTVEGLPTIGGLVRIPIRFEPTAAAPPAATSPK